MIDLKKIIKSLDEIIKKLSYEKNNIVDLKISSQQLEDVIYKFEQILNDYNNILNIDESELKNLSDFCDKKIIYNLIIYRKVFEEEKLSGEILIPDNSYNKIKNLCDEILQTLKSYKKEILLNTQKSKEIVSEISSIKNIKNKLKNSFQIQSSDIDSLIEILRKHGFENNEILIYIVYISCNFMEHIDQENLENMNDNSKILSLDDVNSLFKEFGYDFNQLSAKLKEKILLKGNLNNIKQILEILKDNNIDLNISKGKNTLFISKAPQLIEILIYSNASLVLSIIEIAKEKIKLLKNGEIDFSLLIERPSIFIKNRNRSNKLTDSPDKNQAESIDKNDEFICGCHEDFIANVNLIYSKYLEVYGITTGFKDFFIKHKHKYVFEASHQKIKNMVNVLDMYKISPKYYLRALSSFKSSNMLDLLDLSLELDCYNYVKDNPTRLIVNKENLDFFDNIAKARLISLSETEIFQQNERRQGVQNESYVVYRNKNITRIMDEQNFQFDLFNIQKKLNDTQMLMINEMEKIVLGSNSNSVGLAVMELQKPEAQTILKYLEKYVDPTNELIYNIDGIKISKNKVLRLYHLLKTCNFEESLELIIFIITRNSYLTQNQFEIIYNKFEEFFSEKKRK